MKYLKKWKRSKDLDSLLDFSTEAKVQERKEAHLKNKANGEYGEIYANALGYYYQIGIIYSYALSLEATL